MRIGGIQKLTLLDFPGRPAAIIFAAGCDLRCGYCHNPELVLPDRFAESIPFETVFNFLKKRRGLLDGVVFSGGEPTLQPDLAERIRDVRVLGFAVKLDTNGTQPKVLEKLLAENLLDYVALDLKTSFENYAELVGADVASDVSESLALLTNSKVTHELRSTIWPAHHTSDVLEKMAQIATKSPRWVLQNFRPKRVLNASFTRQRGFTTTELRTIVEQLRLLATRVMLRE